MEDPGQKLKRVRERLGLKYRDVEEASTKIAARRGDNEEFVVSLSRLADIENHGVMPSIFRLYSLCAIYRLDIHEVLEWYGVKLSALASDSTVVDIERTHLIGFQRVEGEVQIPLRVDPTLDLRRTGFLTRLIQRWGRIPLLLLNRLDLKAYCYGLIGSQDWTMWPLIRPGALVVIDDTKREIEMSGWATEHDRPVYFLETREGWACGYCTLSGDQLILQPHPASHCQARVYNYPQDIDVIGRVTGIAMSLEPGRRRSGRSA